MHPCFRHRNVILLLLLPSRAADAGGFIYDGFNGANLLTMDGVASVTDGLLRLTNGLVQSKGHAFYTYPITSSSNGSAASFSTTFVFAINVRAAGADGFIYDGFTGANLTMDGVASDLQSQWSPEAITSGLSESTGHAFYPYPVTNFSSDGSAASFPTTFVFAINGAYPDLSRQGFAFVLSSTEDGEAFSIRGIMTTRQFIS